MEAISALDRSEPATVWAPQQVLAVVPFAPQPTLEVGCDPVMMTVTLAIAASCNHDFNVTRLQRYVTPVTVLNKTDIVDDHCASHRRREGGIGSSAGFRHHLGYLRAADLAPQATDLGRAVPGEPSAHAVRRAGIHPVSKSRAEKKDRVRAQNEAIAQDVEGAMTVGAGFVHCKLRPAPKADVVFVVRPEPEPSELRLVEDSAGLVDAQPVAEGAGAGPNCGMEAAGALRLRTYSGDRSTDALVRFPEE